MLSIFGCKKTKCWRCLRYYEGVAQQYYACYRCDIPIFPGDRYGANVMVYGDYLRVERFHLGCPVDPNDDQKIKKESEQYGNESATKKAA